jgi:hypothetical protein
MSDDPFGPGKATARSLERFPIHTRDTEATQSAWRMEIESDAGRGAIMLIDLPEGQAIYRGDGVFLGWPQDRLAAVFKRLRATPDEPPFELQQLG